MVREPIHRGDRAAQESEASPAARLVERCLSDAHALGASDIHLEPGEDGLRLRARIDGALRPLPTPPPALAPAFLARLRLLAGVDIAEHRLPQDGRFALQVRDGSMLDIRCAFLPVARGEKITLRLLAGSSSPRRLDTLGLDQALRTRLALQLERPDGLVVIAGPTGSGKTTTLYACMEEARREDRSLVSVEDPVEISLDHVAQVRVREEIGCGFAPVLRALLRHDPDVVMVGEMRDSESAAIACRAALTGHLVLTSLHATDAAEVPPRLLDMGVPAYLLHATLRLVVAQRLLRRICPACSRARPTTAEERRAFSEYGLQAPERVHEGPGCTSCMGSGYRGRIAVFAILDPSVSSGSPGLFEAALGRVADGATTLVEAFARCPLPRSEGVRA